MMEVAVKQIGQVTIFSLTSAAQVRNDYAEFQQLVRERLANGELQFVVNLSGCAWIDSSGLGELIKSLVHVMRQGGNLKLAAAPPKLKGILDVTNLSAVFQLYETEAEAIDSY